MIAAGEGNGFVGLYAAALLLRDDCRGRGQESREVGEGGRRARRVVAVVTLVLLGRDARVLLGAHGRERRAEAVAQRKSQRPTIEDDELVEGRQLNWVIIVVLRARDGGNLHTHAGRAGDRGWTGWGDAWGCGAGVPRGVCDVLPTRCTCSAAKGPPPPEGSLPPPEPASRMRLSRSISSRWMSKMERFRFSTGASAVEAAHGAPKAAAEDTVAGSMVSDVSVVVVFGVCAVSRVGGGGRRRGRRCTVSSCGSSRRARDQHVLQQRSSSSSTSALRARMRSIAVRAAHSSERFEAKRERILPCSTVARAMTVIASRGGSFGSGFQPASGARGRPPRFLAGRSAICSTFLV